MKGEIRNDIVEILLVEDNKGDIRLTMEALKETSLHANMCVVNDGEEAINYLKQLGKYSERPKPDMILLDLWLPKKTGHEVLEYIKSEVSLKDIPVAILTSSSAEEDIHKVYEYKPSGYITKKADLKELAKNLQDLWGFSSLKRKSYKQASKFKRNPSENN
jgi:two-component system, chemotaxis family, response regulator Rcp1